MKNLIYLFPIFFVLSCSEKVEKIKVEEQTITESIYASGVIKSENQYQVFPKTNGIIQDFLLQEGDLIKKQQVFCSIYNETSKLSRENAQLLSSFSDIDNNEDKLKDLKINIDFARNKMKNDSINFQRQKTLFERKVISKNEIEQSELMYENSKTTYRSALLKYNELKKQLNFTSQQAKKNVQISQNFENDFLVKSQIDGKIYALLKEKGEMVSVQTPIAIIGDAANFKIELQIDENDIVKIEKKQKVLLNLDSYKDQVFEAEITKINPYLNEKSRTFTVEAKFTKKPEKLFPNLSLEANIIVSKKENALLIPRTYIDDNNVVTLEDGSSKKVKVGLKNYDKVEILEGLKKGEVLILKEK